MVIRSSIMGNIMLDKMNDLPCLTCPVLAICVGKKNIDCQILIDYLGSIRTKNSRVDYLKVVRSIQEIFKKSMIVISNQIVYTNGKETGTKLSNICYWGSDA